MQKNTYSLTNIEFEEIEKLADNIYNTSVVLDYFCKNQREVEDFCYISPILNNLRKDADTLNSFFITLSES